MHGAMVDATFLLRVLSGLIKSLPRAGIKILMRTMVHLGPGQATVKKTLAVA